MEKSLKMTVERFAFKPTYTIGKLYLNGVYFCDTLEDPDRGLVSSMPLSEIASKKIKGDTAIPLGVYKVTLNTVSPKYAKKAAFVKFCGAKMPRVLNVPGYDGILIHPGNTAVDTWGCLLVGENKAVGKVVKSTATWQRLYNEMKKFDSIQIEYKHREK